MSDQVDVNVVAIGGESVDRVTSSLDRMVAALEKLESTSSLGNLAKQMETLQATMVTGFANLSASMEKMVDGMSVRQAAAIEASGEKAAAAMTEAGLKIKAADAKTWEQIQRGSAANVTAAFNQLAQGIPVEAVEARFGKLAAVTAAGMEGQLALLRQFQENAKSNYSLEFKPMAGATEAQLQEAAAMNARFDADRAARQRAFDEASAARAWQNTLDLNAKKEAAEAALAARTAQLSEEAASRSWLAYIELNAKREAAEATLAARTLQISEEAAARSFQNFLDLEAKKEAEAATRAARMVQLTEAAEAASFLTFLDIEAKKEAADAARIARMRQLTEAADAASFQNFLDIEAKKAAAIERNRVLNTNYLTASPASQVRTAQQAQVYMRQGASQAEAEERYGTAAAGANALASAMLRLAAAERESAVSAAASGTAHLELNGVLRQAEGAFRGAAHQAGIYGFHHGQLIALLAGGAVAAGLHHIAETGAEVEFQLASLNALGDRTKQNPIDFNAFIGITAGTMTSLKDAAEGMHALAQAGQNQQAALAALPDVMRLAALGEMSVAQASEMAVESMHAFGKEISDLGEIGDILVAVGAKSNLSVHKLAEDMKSAAVTGALFNLDMKEITATVGVLAERGLTIQPLSSALNKLYEPSAKTAAVMKQWNLDVKDGEGNLKNYTKFMGELAAKVNEFRVPADALKQLGMSTQSIKAMEVMTQHFGDYKHLWEEAENAHGKMFDAMAVKENTAEGTWKRLGSTVEGTFVRAFNDASPIIREVELSLMRMAGSDGAVSALSNLASGVARLTQTFLENIGTVVTLVAAYAGMRMISSLTTMVNEYVIAKRAATALGVEAAAVTRAETAQLELFAVAENTAAAGAARLGVATEVTATGMRLLTASLGWISLAVVGLTAAVDLLSGSMTEADRKHLEQKNTYDSTTDSIQREIDRLKELEKQLQLTGETGTAAASMVHVAFAEMKERQAQSNLEAIEASTPSDSTLRMAGRRAPTSKNGQQLKDEQVAAARETLRQAHEATVQARNQLAELDSVREHVDVLMSVKNLKKGVHELPEGDIKPVLQTPAALAAAKSANEGLHKLHEQEISEENVVELSKVYAQVQKDIAATKATISGNHGAESDAARVAIEQAQEQLRLAQELYKVNTDNLKSQNKRGELGDMQLINAELREKQALDQKALDMARAEKAAAGPLKASQQEKYNSRIKSAEARLGDTGLDAQEAARKRLDVIDKMDTEELQARARALQSKGQLEAAYNLQWQSKNAQLMANLDQDIADAENATYKARLERFKAFMEEQRRLGANDARFKEGKEAFGSAHAELQQRLSASALQNGPGSGLFSALNGDLMAKQAYNEMIPKLQAAQVKVGAASSKLYGGDPEKLKEAQNELRAIQEQMAAMRNTGVAMAQEIGRALTEAFGKGGTAIGAMLTTAASYDAKMQEIDARLKASDGGAAAKKEAADATASAQIKAYGDMAGAAKGFFDTNSNGYKILQKTEQAFRAFELAQALMVTGRKIFFKETEVAANVALNGTKVAGEAASTAASTALAGTEASAWGITAVAKAIASLPPPFNLIAGAATLAALVAVGVKMTGGFGGGGMSAADRQAENGTGTVLGDPKAKSESLAKSLSLVEKNTYNGLEVSISMLTALRSIDSNLSGFATVLMRNSDIANPDVSLKSGISGANMGTAALATTGFVAGSMVTLVGSVLGPVGMLVGALASRIPVVQRLMTSIFGGKQSLDDSGFMMKPATMAEIAANGVNAQSYADVTTSGGWFRSDKHNTQTNSIGAEANRAISQIITSIGDSIKVAGSALGMTSAEFDAKLNGFVVNIGKISLKGLSAADQQAAIQAAFSKLSDQMVQAAFPAITQFAKAGEGALETLNRVAVEYQTVDAVFSSFGLTFVEVGVSSIAAREKLIDLSGGLDKFTGQAEFFLKNFMTQGQQTAATRNAIDPTLAKYGLSTEGRNANQQFAQVTLAFGAMGAAGAEAYAELMRIAPAFKAVTDVAKDLQDQIDDLLMTQAQKDAAARADLDPANQILFDQLQQAKAISAARSTLASSYQSEAQALQSSVDKLKSFSASLRGFLNTLQLSDMSPLNPADKYGAALSQFNTVLSKARGGDADAQANLQSAAQAFLQASKAANASNSTYQNDYQRVTSAVDEMATKASSQATEGQTNLAALRQQVSQLVTLNETSLSIVEAINNLAVTMTNGKDAKTNTTAIESLYRELLGRSADAGGAAYWNQLLQQGVSLSTIIEDIKSSPEYISRMSGMPATTNTTPSTQYGTAAVPALPTPPVTQDPYTAIADQNAKVVAGLATVADQLDKLRAEQQQQADNQVSATLKAAENTGEGVADAIEESDRSMKWGAANQMRIR